MDKVKVLILGSTGMLGSMVLDYLSKKNLEITAPLRSEIDGINFSEYEYIINCVGIISQKLNKPEEAITINSLLPYMISDKAPKSKIIQIATDCVYSGKRGNYTENNEHDALDIYGKTKSLGEVKAENFYNIRTSIIGIAPNSKVSLLDWFLSQEKGATIKGYTNHYWNGITTLHFAKLCYAIIKSKKSIPHNFHFIPKDTVSKYELLKIFSEKFKRKDIHIEKFEAKRCNRTLSTIYPEVNLMLWQEMGYKSPPTIKEMIYEL